MTKRPFIVDPVLTAIAIGYANPAHTLIADQVLPRQPVSQEEFKWTEYPLEEGFTVPETEVGRRGRVNQIELTGTEKTAAVGDYGLESPIPNSDIRAAAAARAQKRSTYDPEARAVETTTNLVQLAREIRVASLVQSLDTYAAARRVTLAGTSQLSDYDNSDPIGVIKTGLEGTLVFRPNTMVMGQAVWSKLSSHPQIVNAIRGNLTNAGIVRRQEVAELFEVSRLLVGESYLNTAAKGQAAALARVWGKHISLLYIDPTANHDAGITFGFSAEFGTRIAGRIEDPDIGLEGGVQVRVGERLKELVVARDCGYLIQNAVA